MWDGGLLAVAAVVIVYWLSRARLRISNSTLLDIRLTQPRRGPDQNRVKKSIEASIPRRVADWLARNRTAAAWQGSPWSLSGPGRRRLVWGRKLCLVPASRAHHDGPAHPVCTLQANRRLCVPLVLCRVARFTSRYSEMIVLYQGARKALPHHQ